MNELIRAEEIRVIANDGEQLGVMTPEALASQPLLFGLGAKA